MTADPDLIRATVEAVAGGASLRDAPPALDTITLIIIVIS